MSISAIEIRLARAKRVIVSADALADGRTISAPLAWYPHLLHGSLAERRNWRLIG